MTRTKEAAGSDSRAIVKGTWIGTVTGTVFHSTEQTFALLHSDCLIEIQRHDRWIIMTSPRWVVAVEIPPAFGKREFTYTWGSPWALFAPVLALTCGKSLPFACWQGSAARWFLPTAGLFFRPYTRSTRGAALLDSHRWPFISAILPARHWRACSSTRWAGAGFFFSICRWRWPPHSWRGRYCRRLPRSRARTPWIRSA